jgi:hypothetical protein
MSNFAVASRNGRSATTPRFEAGEERDDRHRCVRADKSQRSELSCVGVVATDLRPQIYSEISPYSYFPNHSHGVTSMATAIVSPKYSDSSSSRQIIDLFAARNIDMISPRLDFETWMRKSRRLSDSPPHIHGFPSINSWVVSMAALWRWATSRGLNITFLSWEVLPARLNWKNFSAFCWRSRDPTQRPAPAVAARRASFP